VPPTRRLLTMAIQRFSRTNALHTRKVSLDNVLVLHAPPLTCAAGILNRVFDVVEMPLGYYVYLRSVDAPLTAIPVFPDRIFVQQYAYTRPDTGIDSFAGLLGRRVAIPKYFLTAGLWFRALLREEAGIMPADVHWFTTGPEIDARVHPPADVRVTVKPRPYLGLDLLLDGTVDCLLTEATPVVPEDKRDSVVRVHSDPHTLQKAYFERTGFHPIVHVVAVRREVAAEYPGLLQELCAAFDQAKLSSYRQLQNERVTDLPLMRSYLDETTRLFGPDPWPYGLQGRNRPELQALLSHAHEQGLTERTLDADELFAPEVRDYRFEAVMVSGADLGNLGSLLGEPEGTIPSAVR